ncbi:MAG TPA: porin family protein [Cytophagaceae bacterium]|nr:porin family protein [Cytophagaceae bacterium]
MKKILILFLFMSQYSFGQVNFGLKGGIGDAWYNGGQGNQTIYPAFAAGGFMNYAFGKVSFQPELLFSHKGSSFLYNYVGYNQRARSNSSLNYLEIPLSFHYSINDADATPYFGMGLAPAILLFERNTFKYPDGTRISNASYNANAVDLGYIITGGYKMDNFFVEARVNLGLARVYPNSNIRNSVFMIMGGRKF